MSCWFCSRAARAQVVQDVVVVTAPLPPPPPPAPVPTTVDWTTLHDMILAERAARGLSITEFLILCKLDPKMYYLKILCSIHGKQCFPFDNKYFIGAIFRTSVCDYLNTYPRPAPVILVDLENALADWNLDNMDFLSTHHISSINLVANYSTQLIVRLFVECDLTDDAILEALYKDHHIVKALMGSSLHISHRKVCNADSAAAAAAVVVDIVQKTKPLIEELKEYQTLNAPAT